LTPGVSVTNSNVKIDFNMRNPGHGPTIVCDILNLISAVASLIKTHASVSCGTRKWGVQNIMSLKVHKSKTWLSVS